MEIIYIALLTVIAATVGTVTGFGTSTIMIPVLVIFFPPVQAIFLVAIIHMFGDVWKVGLFRKGLDLRLIALFGATGIVASYIGALLSLGSNEQLLLRFLGVFLASYALFLMFKTRFKVPTGNATAVSGGVLSGFFAGMFGIGGAIRSMFLSAFDLPKAVYVATIGAIGIIVDSTRIITYFVKGAKLPTELWWGLLVFIPASFAGAQIAKRVVDRIPQEKFRMVVAAFLFVMGIKLIFFP